MYPTGKPPSILATQGRLPAPSVSPCAPQEQVKNSFPPGRLLPRDHVWTGSLKKVWSCWEWELGDTWRGLCVTLRGLRTTLRAQGAALWELSPAPLGAEPSSHLGFYGMGKGIVSSCVGWNNTRPSPGCGEQWIASWRARPGSRDGWGCSVLSTKPHAGEPPS